MKIALPVLMQSLKKLIKLKRLQHILKIKYYSGP